MDSLTIEHFCDEPWAKTWGTTITPTEAVRLVTPTVYREALESFLENWRRSLSQQDDPEEPENVAHIKALEHALANPDLKGTEPLTLLLCVHLLKENPEGFTHAVSYGGYS